MTTPIGDFQNSLDFIARNSARFERAIYGDKVSRIADRLVGRYLGLLNPAVVMTGRGPNATSPLLEADQAAERGDLSWDEADDLAMADVIVSATKEDGTAVFVVAEISITVQERERIQAQRRAAVLEKAMVVTTIPVVIGIEEETPAAPSGVAFVQFDPEA